MIAEALAAYVRGDLGDRRMRKLGAARSRALVDRYRDDAKRQSDPILREAFENRADDCERFAEQLREFRELLQ